MQDSDSVIKEEAFVAIKRGVEEELDIFSRALVKSPASTRVLFALTASSLEKLYRLTGGENLTDRLEAAQLGFDQTVSERRQAIESRLCWEPERTQNRIDKSLTLGQYEMGQPKWLSGKLNDAPAMIGQKMTMEQAESLVVELERSLVKHLGNPELPRAKSVDANLGNTYFSQGLEPRVQFGQIGDALGVEGYLKNRSESGPRLLEFPLEDGTFAYLMFDGHHRAVAQIMQGGKKFRNLTVMRLDEVQERFGHSEQDILDAIRDLHAHMYMTDTPVPR